MVKLITKLTVIILPERHLECLFPSVCMHVNIGEPIICFHELMPFNYLRILQSRFEPLQLSSNQTIVRTHSLKESQILFIFCAF